MSKFLLIGSIAAVLYGDCAWGIEEIDPWADMSSRNSIDSRENAPALNSGQFSDESARENASPNIRSRRNSTAFSQDAQTQTKESQFEQSWSGQTHANPQQLQENRFIKIETKHNQIQGMANGLTGAILNNTYLQYHYDLSNNSKMGHATPTTVVTITRDDLRCWNDISEIRYANDVSYDKLENPKVILYRNKDNSCYIILRIKDNKHGVFYGINERNIEVGRSSFSVYDLSEDVGSFTDGVERLIYVDESGLYFVPKAENSVEDVIKTYQSEGKFNFRGSVIKVSAVDGSITWNGKPVTKDNFFDNWVLEEREVERQVYKEKRLLLVLSTKHHDEKEIIRNFYPPKGSYIGMYSRISGVDKMQLNTFTEIPLKDSFDGGQKNLMSNKWMDYFVRMHILTEKSKSKEGCEEVVRNGMFSSFLSNFPSHFQPFLGFSSSIAGAVNRQIRAKGISDTFIPANRVFFSVLFRDPEFVRSLKPDFAKLEKDYERYKESELWIPFEIVRNL